MLDCRHMNPCLHLFKVKFEDIKVAESIFQPSSYVFTFDLKSAYHHIDIHPSYRTFLGFSWVSGRTVAYYVYNSLPFGIATAGHIFTKVLRVLIKYWRSVGINIVMFLDDGIGGSTDYDLATKHSMFVRDSLTDVGFLLADDKYDWIPRQVATWLGHVLNFIDNTLLVTDDRIMRLEARIDSISHGAQESKFSLVNVKLLASVIGQIISLLFVLGSYVNLRTRNLYECILCRCSWNSPVQLSKAAVGELTYWRSNARYLNSVGRSFRHFPVVSANVYADASSLGYGGYVEVCFQSQTEGGSESARFDKPDTVHCEVSHVEKVGTTGSSMDRDLYESLAPVSALPQPPEVGCIVGSETPTPINYAYSSSTQPPDVGCIVDSEILTPIDYLDSVCTQIPEASSSVLMDNYIEGSVRLESSSELPEESSFGNLLHENRLPEERYEISRPQNARFLDPYKSSDSSFRLILDSKSKCVIESEVKSPEKVNGSEIYGSWTGEESLKSSTWRELEAVRRVILSNLKLLRNSHIKIFSDNQNVKRILHAGSRVGELQRLSVSVNDICDRNRITFSSVWIPRDENTLADHLSRCQDCDDWYISTKYFEILDRKWGPHTVDRFSTHYNNRCKRFNSRWWVPGTEAVDCFDQCWSGEINWIVPPPRLIIHCIRKLEADKACCTSVVPKWQFAPFWPFITDLNGHYKSFIKEVDTLPLSSVICKGKGNNWLFADDVLLFSMVAMRCVF